MVFSIGWTDLFALLVAIKRVKRRIFQLAEATQEWGQANMTGRVAHDFSSKLISSFLLPNVPLVIKVDLTDDDQSDRPAPQAKGGKQPGGKKGGADRRKEYTLTIKFVGELETESLTKYVFDLFLSLHSFWQRGRCRAPEELGHANQLIGPSVARSSEACSFSFPPFYFTFSPLIRPSLFLGCSHTHHASFKFPQWRQTIPEL